MRPDRRFTILKMIQDFYKSGSNYMDNCCLVKQIRLLKFMSNRSPDVMPTQVGIQSVDSRIRRNDIFSEIIIEDYIQSVLSHPD